MRKILLFFYTFCHSLLLLSQKVNFSDSLEFSVLTVSPGQELYSIFGHSAIRLTDFKNGYDLVFNYGTFDFQTKGFYFKFALGQLDYRLSVESFDDFLQMCQYENRTVVGQHLNLTGEQKRKLLFALVENYRPENRYYRYKFFTDNCATRIRDILANNLSGFQWRYLAQVDSAKTFRQLYRPYLKSMPWALNGIELLLGPMADKPAKYDVMFLPDKLQQALALAMIDNRPLVDKELIIFNAPPVVSSISFFTPMILLICLLLIAIGIEWTSRYKQIFDAVLFSLTGWLGCFILFLSLVSDHSELHGNWTVAFFSPILLFWPWIRKVKLKLILSYCAIISIGGILLLSPLLLQHFNVTTYLWGTVLLIRLVAYILTTHFQKNICDLIAINIKKK